MQSNKHSGAAGDGSIAPFEFVPGPGLSRLRIRFRGFWDESTLALYREALRRRAEEADGPSPVDTVLIDVSDCTVQGQAVMDGMAAILASYRGQIAHYGLLLPRSALTAIQMKRLMGDEIICFESEAAAAAWLGA